MEYSGLVFNILDVNVLAGQGAHAVRLSVYALW